MTATIPPVDYQISVEAQGAGDNGAMRFELRLADVIVNPSKEAKPVLVTQTEEAAAAVKGLTGNFSVDGRGIVGAVKITPPPNATARVHDMLEDIRRALRLAGLPLPTEPVGKGAKWAVTRVIKQGGITIQQRSVFELRQTGGSRLRVKVAYEQSAPDQSFTPPGNAPGVVFKLSDFTFTGDGEGTWRTDRFLPRSGKEMAQTQYAFSGAGPGQEMVTAKTEVHLTIKGK